MERSYSEASGDIDSASEMESSSHIERWKRGKAHKPRLQYLPGHVNYTDSSLSREHFKLATMRSVRTRGKGGIGRTGVWCLNVHEKDLRPCN